MPTDVWLAIIGLFAALFAAMAYGLRKYADVKEKTTIRRLDHELEMEKKREERENSRQQRDIETTRYIQTNTEVLRSLKEAIEKELGNGIHTSMRESASCQARILTDIKEVLTTVKNIESQVGDRS